MVDTWVILAQTANKVTNTIFGSRDGGPYLQEKQANTARNILRAKNITLRYSVLKITETKLPARLRRTGQRPEIGEVRKDSPGAPEPTNLDK